MFRPTITCADGGNGLQKKIKASKVPLVGKLMESREDVDEEMNNVDLVLEADPQSKFTIVPMGSCKVKASKSAVSDCGAVTKDLTERLKRTGSVPQLVVEDGGRDLKYYMLHTDTTVMTIFRAAIPIVKGLIALKEKNIVHMDIKPENIVFNGTYAKLIDHGLMREADDTLFERLRFFGLFQHSYPWYPPEFDWLSKMEMGRKHFKTDVENTKIEECVMVSHIPGVDTHRARDIAAMDKTFRSTLKPSMKKIYRELSKSDEKFWSKIDVYSLGITLGEYLAEKYRHHGLTPHQLDAAVTWIAGATHFNVYERFTPEKSYEAYIKIFKDVARKEQAVPKPKQRGRSSSSCRSVKSLENRRLPAYVAKDCADQTKNGGDGRAKYISVPNKRGVYYWKKI